MSYHMSACHVIMFPWLAWVACSTGSTFSTFASMSLTLALALHYTSQNLKWMWKAWTILPVVRVLAAGRSIPTRGMPVALPLTRIAKLYFDVIDNVLVWISNLISPRQYWQCHQTTGSISATVIDNYLKFQQLLATCVLQMLIIVQTGSLTALILNGTCPHWHCASSSVKNIFQRCSQCRHCQWHCRWFWKQCGNCAPVGQLSPLLLLLLLLLSLLLTLVLFFLRATHGWQSRGGSSMGRRRETFQSMSS